MAEKTGRALVVDDDPLNRVLLVKFLENEGHTALTASDGNQALEVLQEVDVDLVLLDLVMPGLDGFSVLNSLKGNAELRHIPVIVISGSDEFESVIRSIEQGAEDYLNKPFDPVLLRARINAGLTKKRLYDLELEYLEQINFIVAAAQDIEEGNFDPVSLDAVVDREDGLGQLARVFQRMAQEVYSREQRLRSEVQKLQIVIDEAKTARAAKAITDTDYFQRLEKKVGRLRSRSEDPKDS